MSKHLNHKLKRGFTLIEAVVYTAILVVIMSAIVSFLIWAIRANDKTKAMREVISNSQRIMSVLSYEIREAKSIYTPTTDATQLSLEELIDVPPNEDLTYVDFYLYNGALMMKRESQSPIAVNADDVEVKNLNFDIISTTSTYPSVRVSFEVDYKNSGNNSEYSASLDTTSTISLRNY